MKIFNDKTFLAVVVFVASAFAVTSYLKARGIVLCYIDPRANHSDKLKAMLVAGTALKHDNPKDIKAAANTLPAIDLKCATQTNSETMVNVKNLGAKGDGLSNDTGAIQAAIDQVTGTGGTVLVPAGTYLIDAATRLRLKNDMTFRMESGAVLKAMPNNKENFAILNVKNANNVNIVGGIIQGERNEHLGDKGEWGMGIELYGSKNVVIENVTSKDNWGDGFYVSENAINTKFCNVVADNNRRHGMSIVSADGITVTDSIFQHAGDTNPLYGAGIDIEPNKAQTVKNYLVQNSKFIKNKGCGIISSASRADGTAVVENGVITDNQVTNNAQIGIHLLQQHGIQVTNNTVNNNLHSGIILNTGSSENIVRGNTVNENGTDPNDKKSGNGILMYQAIDNTVENNTAIKNTHFDIFDYPGKNNVNNNKADKIQIGWH